MADSEPLVQRFDSLQLRVDGLEAAVAFYRDRLGHRLVWRTETAAGLALGTGDGELVLQTDRPTEVDLLVGSADDAAQRFVEAGGRLLAGPFDIQIGRAAVVQDPWGNQLVLLDMSKGRLVTDDDGNIVGNEPEDG